MVRDESGWLEYYLRLTGRRPRALLVRVLALFESEAESDTNRQAIDLGCGDGTESLVLINHGWDVLAIDHDLEALRLVGKKIPAEQRGKLQLQHASFETARWIMADLVYAGLSLPFCAPQDFHLLWQNIIGSLRLGGRFAGHFFGERDTWATKPEMTFFSREGVELLFENLEVEYFDEEETDSPTALGEPHHWHIFQVIAKKWA